MKSKNMFKLACVAFFTSAMAALAGCNGAPDAKASEYHETMVRTDHGVATIDTGAGQTTLPRESVTLLDGQGADLASPGGEVDMVRCQLCVCYPEGCYCSDCEPIP